MNKILFQILPCIIDIIKHPNEHDGKSTSIHAAVVAPEMVKIYTFPNFPDYSSEDGVSLYLIITLPLHNDFFNCKISIFPWCVEYMSHIMIYKELQFSCRKKSSVPH